MGLDMELQLFALKFLALELNSWIKPVAKYKLLHIYIIYLNMNLKLAHISQLKSQLFVS